MVFKVIDGDGGIKLKRFIGGNENINLNAWKAGVVIIGTFSRALR